MLCLLLDNASEGKVSTFTIFFRKPFPTLICYLNSLTALNTSFEKWFPQRHKLICYAKIDDHGVHQGNTGWILALWRLPVTSRVALDLPYWAMCSAPYRLICMAIEMAHEAGPFFSIIDFMSCMTVAKRPCYGLLKIKLTMYSVSYYIMATSRQHSMPFWLSLLTTGERILYLTERE
jgi:hypothetical protein